DPKLPLRHSTAGRSARSATLLVGSTPSTRQVLWSPFVVLEDRVFLGAQGAVASSRMVAPGDPGERVWVDPTARAYHGCQRAGAGVEFQGGGSDGLNFISSAEAPLG